jgi:Suppressor of fused protein (SUFU)
MLAQVRAHLRAHFAEIAGAEPESASVKFLGTDPIEVLRFGPGSAGLVHYASLGCSRHAMGDDPVHGPRAEVVVRLRGPSVGRGLVRSVAVLAAAPAVEGLVLSVDALVDLGRPLWEFAPFSAFLLGPSDIAPLEVGAAAVEFFQAVPITATEAAWVRLKGADAMREAWQSDGVDVLHPRRLERPG